MEKRLDKIFICNISLLKKNSYKVIWVDNWKDELIIFRNDQDKIKIFSSICPHFGGEIYYDVKEKILRCKWHDWKFCVETGKCLTYQILGKLKAYDFTIDPKNLKNYSYTIENNDIYAVREK